MLIDTLQEEMVQIPFVPCPFDCTGWLVSSQHRECFDNARQVWRFQCPDCEKDFEVRDLGVRLENVPLGDVRRKYPDFRRNQFSRFLPHRN